MNAALQETWTRQKYLEAYIHDYDQPNWEAFTQKQRMMKKWGRYQVWDLQPYAMLYRETHDEKYARPVEAALLSMADQPPLGDVNASLAGMGYLYDHVSSLMTAADRQKVEQMLSVCANACLKREMGTAMNRGLSTAGSLAWAIKLLPHDPNVQVWKDTVQKMMSSDFERIGDTNEDSNNYHRVWAVALLVYAQAIDADPHTFYAQPAIKAIFERWLQSANPLGSLPAYGASEWHYPTMAPVWEALGAGLRDGRYRWLAQRNVDYFHANGLKMPNVPITDFVDDTVPVTPPDGKSYYNDSRMGAQIADKLIVRSGNGPDDTYAAFDLLNEGGHGKEDATALVELIDGYAPLLLNPLERSGSDEAQKNLVLFRRSSEQFPFTDVKPFSDPEWRRVIHPIRFQITAIGGPNIDFAAISGIGLRIDPVSQGRIELAGFKLLGSQGEKVVQPFADAPSLPKGATVTTGPLPGMRALSEPVQRWINFPWTTQDISGYDDIEYWYRFVPPLPSTATMETTIQSANAVGRWWFFDTHRDSKLAALRDAPGYHLGALDIIDKPYSGGEVKQSRAILMLPGRLVWIRDTMCPVEDGNFQFGPLWQIDKVLRQGADWIQTAMDPPKGADGYRYVVWTCPPGNLCIRIVPEQDGSTVQLAPNLVDSGAHTKTFYGNWKGEAKKGAVYAFDSFLIPNLAGADAQADLAAQVHIIHATPEWTVVQDGDDYLVANPLGRTLTAGNLTTDFCYLHLQVSNGKVIAAEGNKGTRVTFDGREIHHADQAGDFSQ